jgi:hypothetical protein
MQDAVSNFMPEVAEVVADELQRTLDAHDIQGRLNRAAYGQEYTYTLPDKPGEAYDLDEALNVMVGRVGDNFRHICRQATMYELVRPERSIHEKVRQGEQELALPEDDRLLDIVLKGPEAVRRDLAAQSGAAAPQAVASASGNDQGAEVEQEGDIMINILDAPAPETGGDLAGIKLGEEMSEAGYGDLEISYAEKLDNIALKTNRIFGAIIDDLFGDDTLLPRLRRLFWLEATKAERDFNNHLVKPMLKQHDRNLADPELRKEMEIDLESVSDVEELMRVWEGLHALEGDLPV